MRLPGGKRLGLGCGLTWGLALALGRCVAQPALAHAEEEPYQPLLLGGVGAGLADSLSPAFEAHVGVGVRQQRIRLLGVVDYVQYAGGTFFQTWTVTRRQVGLSALAVYYPIEGVRFHLHGALGAGRAWDHLDFGSETASSSRFIGIASLGAGYSYFTLLGRVGLPGPRVTSGNATFGAGDGLQVLLTFSCAAEL